MSKTQRALGKLRHKIQQAETDARTARRIHEQAKRVTSLNDTLNATVVEQNERMETLAANCTHYRQRIADLQAHVAELEDKNGELYSQNKTVKAARQEERSEYMTCLRQDRKQSDEERDRLRSALRSSRVATIVVTVALLAVTVWPYAVKLVL